MGMFTNAENHELSLPIGYEEAFLLLEKTAKVCGEIQDSNKLLGIISYKVGMSFTKLRNPASVKINVSKQGDGSLVRVNVDSQDGVGAFRTSSRTYDAFMQELSHQSKQ